MKSCDKCKCTGRVKRLVEEEGGGGKAVYICPNPRCANYRVEFAEEVLEMDPGPQPEG